MPNSLAQLNICDRTGTEAADRELQDVLIALVTAI